MKTLALRRGQIFEYLSWLEPRWYVKGVEETGTYTARKIERKGVRVQTLVQRASEGFQAGKWRT